MRKILVEVEKYRSENDGTVFESADECAQYDEMYRDINFIVEPEKLKIFDDGSWEHFKYYFLRYFAAVFYKGNGGFYRHPIHIDFYKNVKNASDTRLMIERALKNTYKEYYENAFGKPCIINKYQTHLPMQYYGDNGYMTLRNFNIKEYDYRMFMLSRTAYLTDYKYYFRIYTKDSTISNYPLGMEFNPSYKSYYEFIKFIYGSRVIVSSDFIKECMDHAKILKDKDAITFLKNIK